MGEIKTAIGLMSGTSIDGIDLALIKSDGKNHISGKLFYYHPYEQKLREQIKKLINNQISNLWTIKEIENEITNQHILAVQNFLDKNNIKAAEVDIIGFHGHTIYHNPKKLITWQIGNAQMLATKTGINVVADFRIKDVVMGGQGAPLVPIYHLALLQKSAKPIAVLNIGGVSNITFIKDDNENNLIAFDSCFGNAPMDDLIKEKTGENYDKDGKLAQKGQVDKKLAEEFLKLEYFSSSTTKSLDRNQFNPLLSKIYSLGLENSLATLSYILGQSIKIALNHFSSFQLSSSSPLSPSSPLLPSSQRKLGSHPASEIPAYAGMTIEAGMSREAVIAKDTVIKEIVVCGGGRKNLSLMENIKNATQLKITNIDELGINGDAVEAEAFAYLAIRHLMNLPISFTKTTGVLPAKHDYQPSEAINFSSCGGVFYRA